LEPDYEFVPSYYPANYAMRFKFLQKKITAPRAVVLRDSEDAEGTRLLEASLSSDGDILIQGRDYGDGVEKVLGVREYEWAWKIPADQLPVLLRALEADDDVLSALKRRFSGNDAAHLGPFLDAHGIATEKWSRLGD
jgi:hypothetical protein